MKKKKKDHRILIAVGGTGGHIFPSLQLAEKLEEKNIPICFAGYKLATNPFFPRERFSFQEIRSAPLKRIGGIILGVKDAISLFRTFKPTTVIGFGSYHTVPLLIAAKLFRCQLILFEPNVILGRVNSLFSLVAKDLCMQFPPSHRPWKEPTMIKRLPWKIVPILHKREKKEKRILIFGGSQGAKILNETLPQALKQLAKKVTIVHIAGKMKEEVESVYKQEKIAATVLAFHHHMGELYAEADLVIARSGASTIAELIHYEKPSILIPYPFATHKHQEKNGFFLQEIGGALVIDQLFLQPELLAEKIDEVLEKKGMEMKKALKAYKKRESTKDFVELILER